MEITIIKKETTGTGPNTYTDNSNIAKYEIMDGAPVRGKRNGFHGEKIKCLNPISCFLYLKTFKNNIFKNCLLKLHNADS